jgi:predicted nucleotidyltransferase
LLAEYSFPLEIKRALQRIVEIAEKKLDAELVILHGSYAKNTYILRESDVDVVIVSRKFQNVDVHKRFSMLSEAFKKVSSPVEAVGFTKEEFLDEIKKMNPFILDVMEYGIPLTLLMEEAKKIFESIKKKEGLEAIEEGWRIKRDKTF